MKKKIYPKDHHKLEALSIDKDALYVLEKLTAAGHIAYLVGGGVRDLLLDQKPKDYDISTSAKPEEIKKLFRNCILIGRRFRLAHIRFGSKIIEVATFRSGNNEDDTLILRDNEWGSPEEDVLRRDFTINGLFYNAAGEEIIDYVGGVEDLKKGLLRTIGQPFIRFKQDPVRMLRLLKFKARFGLKIDPQANEALLEARGEIIKSSSARILEELLRMLESGAATPFIRLLVEYQFLPLLLPSLVDFMETPKGEEIFTLLKEIDKLSLQKETFDRALPLAALTFPLFERRLNALFGKREKPPHLGEIQEEADSLFDEVFSPFFKIPRRLKMIVVFILSSQLRLVPFSGKKPRSFRIPNDPSFSLAIAFLSLRAATNETLHPYLQSWLLSIKGEASDAQPFKKRTKKRRSYRRKKGPSNTHETSSS